MVFAPNARDDAAPVRTIQGDSTRMTGATALALDDDGRLYVANNKEAGGINAYGPDLGSVTVYRPGAGGNKAPEQTIEGSYTRLNGPLGLARDRSGNLYVVNQWGTGPGSVTVYGPQAEEDVRPIRMIAGPATGLQRPAGAALDAHDTLYVVNQRTVTVYAPGATGDASPVRTIGGS
jgi:sugar lactone lactonase YvrE